jgi:hypothetical protein
MKPIYAVMPHGNNYYITRDYAQAQDIPVTDTQSGLWFGPYKSGREARANIEVLKLAN